MKKRNGLIDTNGFVTQIASNQLNDLVYRGIVHTFHLPIAGGTGSTRSIFKTHSLVSSAQYHGGFFAELPFLSEICPEIVDIFCELSIFFCAAPPLFEEIVHLFKFLLFVDSVSM